MGPFPHDAPPATISQANPAGTDGFEFVEFAHPEPDKLARLFARMGYREVARHKTKDISLYRQGSINYVLNREPTVTGRAFRRRARAVRAGHGVARRRCPARVEAGVRPRRQGIHRHRQIARRARRHRHRRIAAVSRRDLWCQGLSPTSRNTSGSASAIRDPRASASTTSTTSPITSCAATWTPGTLLRGRPSISARSASSISKASSPACTAAR